MSMCNCRNIWDYNHIGTEAWNEEVNLAVCYYIVMPVNGKALLIIR